MKKKIAIAGILAVVTAVIIYLALPAKPVTGPPAHPWASFPPGAWVLRRETVRMGGKPLVSMIRHEVLSSSPLEARIRVTTVHADGSTDSQEQIIGTGDEDYSREGFTSRGTTQLIVQDQTIRCEIFEKGETVRWFSDRVPAWPVFEIIQIEGERVDIILKQMTERFTISGKELACPGYEERRSKSSAFTWKSDRVPGHIVKRREIQQHQGIKHDPGILVDDSDEPTSILLEVIDFDAKRP